MISNVKGEFRKFHAEIDGEDFSSSSIQVVVDTSSVFTNDENRDAHLKGADFFDCENHPEMVFKSKSFKLVKGDLWALIGDLTIRGNTREIVLDVEAGGLNKDPWGNEKAGFSVSAVISRKDWGSHGMQL